MNNLQYAVHIAIEAIIYTASVFSVDGVKAAGVFAEGAGKVVGIIGTGVDGFIKLASFQGITQGAINNFQYAIHIATEAIIYTASVFSVEGVKAAAVFAEGAGKVIGIIGSGVDGLTKLAGFQGIAQAAIAHFERSIIVTISSIIWVASMFTAEAIGAANAFADGVNKTVATIVGTLDTFGKLASFEGIAGGVLDQFVVGLANLLHEVTRQVFPASQNIGWQLAHGIAAGIDAGAPAIQNAIFAAVNAALAAARAALGIASPSKVFKEQIGVQMSAGMAEGVMGGMGQVQQAVSQVSSGALGATGGSTTNNNQRSIVFEPGAIVVGGNGGSPYATADAVVTEINRRLGMQGA
jgi:hypothetical protein